VSVTGEFPISTANARVATKKDKPARKGEIRKNEATARIKCSHVSILKAGEEASQNKLCLQACRENQNKATTGSGKKWYAGWRTQISCRQKIRQATGEARDMIHPDRTAVCVMFFKG